MEDTGGKIQNDKQTILSIIKYALIAVIVLAVGYVGLKVLWLLFPVVIGFILAFTSVSVSAFFYRLIMRRRPRTIAEGGDTRGFRALKFIVFTLILLICLGFIVFVVFALIAQVRNLMNFVENNVPSVDYIQKLSDYLHDVSTRLGGFLPPSAIAKLTDELTKLQNDLLALIPKIISALLNSLLSFISNFPNILFKVIVVIMAGYYYISDRIVIGRFMNMLFPSRPFVEKVVSAVTKVSHSLFRVLGGYIIIMTVTFLETLAGLIIIRMPYAIIIACVVMLIDLLPMVGANACFIPIAIYMFMQGKPLYGIIALAMVGIMALVRSTIEPRIVGNAMRLHPLATLVAMLLGVAAFGLAGFLGGPILVVFAIGLSDAFGFQESFREWSGRILNKVARADTGTCGSAASADAPVPEAGSEGGIRHIVMWRLKETAHGLPREEVAAVMQEKLMSLPSKIPQILRFEVMRDIKYDRGAYDLVLTADFASEQDLDLYKKHPEHVAVAEWIHGAILERSTVDCRI